MSVLLQRGSEGHERTFKEKVALAVEIAAIYPRARWLLHRRGLRSAVSSLRGHNPATETDPEHQLAAARLGRIVGRVLEPLPFDSRCLMRSLVLTALLARRGVFATVVVGVRTEPFAAHAWVESNGEPLLPRGDFSPVVEV